MGETNPDKYEAMETNQNITSEIPLPPEDLLHLDMSDDALTTSIKDLNTKSVVQYIQSISDRKELIYILEQTRLALGCEYVSEDEDAQTFDEESNLNLNPDQLDNRSDITNLTAISKKRKNASPNQARSNLKKEKLNTFSAQSIPAKIAEDYQQPGSSSQYTPYIQPPQSIVRSSETQPNITSGTPLINPNPSAQSFNQSNNFQPRNITNPPDIIIRTGQSWTKIHQLLSTNGIIIKSATSTQNGT